MLWPSCIALLGLFERLSAVSLDYYRFLFSSIVLQQPSWRGAALLLVWR